MTMKIEKRIIVEEELPNDVQNYLVIGAVSKLQYEERYADKKSILAKVNSMYGDKISFSEKQLEASLKRLEKSGNVQVMTEKGETTYATHWKQL
jgi:hypothetical protein